MSGQMTTQQLREQLGVHLDTVAPPSGDLAAVRRRARNGRRGRIAAGAGLAAAAVAAAALVVTQTGGGRSGPDSAPPPVATTGDVDLGKGLRAFADPAGELHMGGATLSNAMESFDTDAVATPYGIVSYDEDGWPTLLRPDGKSVQLDVMGSSKPSDDFSPTVKADALRPHVAFALADGKDATVTVYDLEKRSVVATYGIRCSDGCPDLVIDGIDSGAVFIRVGSSTSVWNYDRDESTMFARNGTRVADVRNQVVLYDGPPPSGELEGWRYVPGAIDAQLTFDGEHVLYWSSTLEPSRDGGSPVVLDEGPADGKGLAWWAVDTDGSVLVAVAQPDEPGGNVYTGDNIVYDCEVPSGRCEDLGPLRTTSGDPMFIGSDM